MSSGRSKTRIHRDPRSLENISLIGVFKFIVKITIIPPYQNSIPTILSAAVETQIDIPQQIPL